VSFKTQIDQFSIDRAVQTLSRLNRAHPKKHDVFVLDFMNDSDTIQAAFADFYLTTILAEETDPNKLHDLKAALDGYQVYADAQVADLVSLYLGGADRDELDPILDACVATYREELDEDGQVDFKGKAKAFLRAYGFLSSVLPYTNAEWEKLSIFLTFLVPKLPAPIEEGLSKGILEAIDMDSYRVEKKAGEDSVARLRCRDRARSDQRRWLQARTGARSPVEHTQGVQRPVWEHTVERCRPRAQARHRGHPEPRRCRHRLPKRQTALRPAERENRARQSPVARDDPAVLKDDTELPISFPNHVVSHCR
jgi:hypothetical protein